MTQNYFDETKLPAEMEVLEFDIEPSITVVEQVLTDEQAQVLRELFVAVTA